MPRPGRFQPQVAQTTIARILNATAESDDDARKKAAYFFGTLLVATCTVDVFCSYLLVTLVCRDCNSGGEAVLACVRRQVQKGLSKKSWSALTNEMGNVLDKVGAQEIEVGDLFLLSLFRSIITMLVLIIGIKFGKSDTCIENQSLSGSETNPSCIECSDNDLDVPLLTANGNIDQRNTNRNEDCNDVEDQQSNENNGTIENTTPYLSRLKVNITPTMSKNIALVLLFGTSIFFQVYTGFKVSSFPESATSTFTKVLMCLTILWINASAYFSRTLLDEMTREKGLFLSPEIHRHPVFYQENRNLSMHRCDVCSQRLSSLNNNTGGTRNTSEGACYRCSLCDFDICMKCARRSDAATVGENMLRSDTGVRVQTSLDSSSYFRRSLQLVRSELYLLIVAFALLTASTLAKLFLPHLQGKIIDNVISDSDGSFHRDRFVHYIKEYIVFMMVGGTISALHFGLFTLVGRRLKFNIRNSLFERILSQDVAYFDGTESGRLISHLTNDLDLMMMPIQSSLSSLLNNLLLLAGGFVFCFVKSYRLSIIAFVTVNPITYLWNMYAQWSRGLAREMLSYWAEGNSIASQALSHIKTVKAFGCEERVIEKYTEVNKCALDCGVKDAWGNGLTSAISGYLDLGSGVLILYFGGLLVFRGEMSVGELVTFQLFWNMMNNAYQNLQGLVTNFTRSSAGAERIFSLFDSSPDIDPNQGDDINWEVKGDLELKNVKFFYQMRPDNIVLKHFFLSIPSGKTVALVGRSGGGKSTIINLLLRFYDPKEGKIIIDGRDYKSLNVTKLRRMFGVVTQETELFSLTVEENIAYGMRKDEYSMDELIDAAKKAQAYDFINSMKDGFQTRIGERGNRLSGGQKQRIAIARVFLRRPKIILLDEATSALDEHSQEAVQKALTTLISESNATVVLVAHRLTTVMNADSIVVIDKGVVLEQGNHNELLSRGGVYASMVQKNNKKMSDKLNQEKHDTQQSFHGVGSQTLDDDINALLSDKKTV